MIFPYHTTASHSKNFREVIARSCTIGKATILFVTLYVYAEVSVFLSLISNPTSFSAEEAGAYDVELLVFSYSVFAHVKTSLSAWCLILIKQLVRGSHYGAFCIEFWSCNHFC